MEKRAHDTLKGLEKLSSQEMESLIKRVAKEVSERDLWKLGKIWHRTMVERLGKSPLRLLDAEEWLEEIFRENPKMQPRSAARYCMREKQITTRLTGAMVKAARRVKKKLELREKRKEEGNGQKK